MSVSSVTIKNNAAAITNNFYNCSGEDERYYQARKWADRYTDAMNNASYTLLAENGLIAPIFTLPTPTQDRNHGVDMLMDFQPLKISHRTRGLNCRFYFKQGFTLRDTEISKILEGKYQADYMLYALGQKEEGLLEAAKLIDMRLVVRCLRNDPALIDKGNSVNNFVEFPYGNSFWPEDVVVGQISYTS